MRILEVNDNDIYGKIFNGYDIMQTLNKDENFMVNQAVINKLSDNPLVYSFFSSDELIEKDYKIHKAEYDIMSTHSLLSLSTLMLRDNVNYQKSDLVHFHQVHNCRFSLPTFFDMAKIKPTIISFHDPWFLTGRCVHPMQCDKWKNGCKNCNNLKSIFDLEEDNCQELWKLKSEISKTDIDIIVHSDFMYEMVKENPYTKNLRVHNIPLGIDVSKYNFKLSKEEAKKKLNIFPDDIVIFFREQKELKGTDYIVSALKKLKNKSNITLLTCSQKGHLKDIEDDFNIIELGVLEEKDVLLCYNAADLFLMPSLAESFGMMAVEAMAAGIPTIVFDNSALPSTTGAPEVGILVNNLDSDDLCEKIEYYLENPKERLKRGKSSKAYVTSKYNLNDYYKKIKEVYVSAYNKQKYKLLLKTEEERAIDFQTVNAKHILSKLNLVYDEVFNDCYKPDFLKLEKNIRTSKKIKYSDQNVLNIIKLFNEEVYIKSKNKLEKIEKQNKEEKNNNPKVSIIIPVYNGEKYVSLAIDSALRQTYDNLEIIVVNDGSKDKTDKICKSYGNKIKYIKKENGGVSTALNVGIENMTGEYFSWLSHDDLYYPEKIQTEIDYLKWKNLIGSNTILYSNYDTMKANGELLGNIVFDSEKLNKDSAFSLLKGAINGLSLLIPKKAFNEVGKFDENLRCVQDYQLWFEMIKKGYNFIHIPHTLVVTRIHEKSVTNTSPKVVSEGNEFWLNVIKSFPDEEKIRLYGSIYNYYYELSNFFTGGPYNKALEFCLKKCLKIENKHLRKIRKTKVGIILPFHNEISSTIRAINSALNQTFDNIEIILINNGSTENLNEINKIIEINKEKIKFISYKTKECISKIYNDIIYNTNCEYISFLKQNSIIDMNKIEIQLTKMISSEDVISHTSYFKNIDNNSVYVGTGYISGNVVPEIISDYNINISTFMIKREYLINNSIKFPENISDKEDDFLYLSMLGNNILGIREALTTTFVKGETEKDIKMRIGYIIRVMLQNPYFNNNNNIIKRLFNLYSSPLSGKKENFNEWHNEELKRYSYMLTKEYYNVNKFRKIKNIILLKKKIPSYKIDTNLLMNSKLNRYYRKLRNNIKK